MQPFGKPPSRHHATRELVDDHHIVVTDDIVLVAGEDLVRLERRIEVVDDRDVVDVIERARFDQPVALEDFLELFDALVGKARRAVLFVDRIVFLDQQRNVFVDGLVKLGSVL